MAGVVDNMSDSNPNGSNNNAAASFESQLLRYLKEMNEKLDKISAAAPNMSQSDARAKGPSRADFRDRYKQDQENQRKNKQAKSKNWRNTGNAYDDFLDSFEDTIFESFLGSNFKKEIGDVFNNLAKSVGIEVSDIPGVLGRELGKSIMGAFKNTAAGKSLHESIAKAKSDISERLWKSFMDGVDRVDPTGQSSGAFSRARNDAHNGNRYGEDYDPNNNGSAYTESQAEQSSRQSRRAEGNVSDAVNNANNIRDFVNNIRSNIANNLGTIFGGAGASAGAAGAAGAGAAGAGAAGAAGTGLATVGAGTTGALAGGIGSATAAAGPYALAAIAAIYVVSKKLEQLKEVFAPLAESWSELKKASKEAMNRYANSRKAMQENEKKRFEADVKTIIEKPFQILEDAASKVYEVWDAQLRTINQTQGYNKEQLQSLLGTYANRLREEGLSEVVSSADIVDSLSKVLSSGLSGQAAEEFAYLATKLNSAVPTQDFFGYADTYASIVGNAIAAGKSQSQAIAEANAQLEQFASNLLYTSRQLTGGLGTGLKNAQTLFEDAVKISQTAKTYNASDLSGLLTSISGAVSSVAPDLASSLVDNVVKAAIGGNSEQIVALRSLAGINASNTDFLKQLANDPKTVFSNMFKQLAKLQGMSNDNYMEVAEGLSQVFGISMDAFARVDFNRLANAIESVEVNNKSLEENLALLASGESTTSEEQLKIAQINKYMIEEGLSYVLDNEAARAIQQHMWDEQIANRMMEAEYGVNLQGAALGFLEGISQTVQNILDFLNPFAWLKKLGNLIGTAAEANGLEADIRQVLELGKVGAGNTKDLTNLITRGVELPIVQSLPSMMGGASAYESIRSLNKIRNSFLNPITSLHDVGTIGRNGLSAVLQTALGNMSRSFESSYTWSTISKSAASAISNLAKITESSSPSTNIHTVSAQTATSQTQAKLNSKLETMLSEDYMKDMINNNKTFADWKSSSSNFGIANIESALEGVGLTLAQAESQFNSAMAGVAAEQENIRKEKWDAWRDDKSSAYFDYMTLTWTVGTTSQLATIILNQENHMKLVTEFKDATNTNLNKIYNKAEQWYKDWVKYYVEFSGYYANSGFTANDVAEIGRKEKKDQGDTVYALADALTKAGLDLKDPTLQTNALLAQILIVANQILQQQNSQTGNSSLVESMIGLATGLTR